MSANPPRHPLLLTLLVAALLATPAAAVAHGGDEPGGGGEGGDAEQREAGMTEEEAEIAALATQPARTLAQQAISLLEVRGDEHEAGVRLDAALESEDKSDVDIRLLSEATEKLDSGDPEGAVPLLDEALSRPLGSSKGKALHEAGREFQPGTGAQEVVGIVAGAVLLLLGALSLRPGRSRARRVVS